MGLVMWYVRAEEIEETVSWWGPFEKEEDAEKVAEMVDGTVTMI